MPCGDKSSVQGGVAMVGHNFKMSKYKFCVQSMLPARFTANFKESVLTIVFGIETEEA